MREKVLATSAKRPACSNALRVRLISITIPESEPATDGSIKDESNWPEFIEWFLKWNAAFKRVLEPAVKALDESLWENTVASE